MSTESTATSSSQQGGPPNRPLPPTPDDDAQGDRTLIMKRVSEDNKKMRNRKRKAKILALCDDSFLSSSHVILFVQSFLKENVKRDFSKMENGFLNNKRT